LLKDYDTKLTVAGLLLIASTADRLDCGGHGRLLPPVADPMAALELEALHGSFDRGTLDGESREYVFVARHSCQEFTEIPFWIRSGQ
jgi:hypothetical protein